MFTKIKAGEYKLNIQNKEYTVIKIRKDKWHLVLDNKLVNEGKTRAQAAEYKPEDIEILEFIEIPERSEYKKYKKHFKTNENIEIHTDWYNVLFVSVEGTEFLYSTNGVNLTHIKNMYKYAKKELSFLTNTNKKEQKEQKEQKEKKGIGPECINKIAPKHELYWIQNFMSMSTLEQLDTIITDNPSLFGEIVEYCVDNDEYYCYLISSLKTPKNNYFGLAWNLFVAEAKDILYGKANSKGLLKAVQQAANQAMKSIDKIDMSTYDAINALYKAGTRSTNAAYYAVQAGVKKEDIVRNVLKLMEV